MRFNSPDWFFGWGFCSGGIAAILAEISCLRRFGLRRYFGEGGDFGGQAIINISSDFSAVLSLSFLLPFLYADPATDCATSSYLCSADSSASVSDGQGISEVLRKEIREIHGGNRTAWCGGSRRRTFAGSKIFSEGQISRGVACSSEGREKHS